jgi:hypothetical protein
LFISNDNGLNFDVKNNSFSNKRFQIVNDSTYILIQNVDPFFSNGFITYLISYDFGNTWNTKYFKNQNGDTINKSRISFVYFWNDGRAVSISIKEQSDSKSFIYLSNDFGNTWRVADTTSTQFENFNTEINERTPIYQFDGKLFFRHPSNMTKIVVLSGFGEKIDEISNNNTNFTGYAFKDSLNGIFYQGNNKYYKTNNGGLSFDEINSPPNNSQLASSLISYAKPTQNNQEDYYIAAGGNGLYATFDNGLNWTTVDLHKYAYLNFRDVDLGVAFFQDIDLLGDFEIYYTNKLKLSLYNLSKTNNFIKTYPNPSNGNFSIQLEEPAKIQIYTIAGTLVYSGNLEPGVQQVSLPSLSSGLYILKAYSANFQQFSRIIVE